jgi:hypothetical protein
VWGVKTTNGFYYKLDFTAGTNFTLAGEAVSRQEEDMRDDTCFTMAYISIRREKGKAAGTFLTKKVRHIFSRRRSQPLLWIIPFGTSRAGGWVKHWIGELNRRRHDSSCLSVRPLISHNHLCPVTVISSSNTSSRRIQQSSHKPERSTIE